MIVTETVVDIKEKEGVAEDVGGSDLSCTLLSSKHMRCYSKPGGLSAWSMFLIQGQPGTVQQSSEDISEE